MEADESAVIQSEVESGVIGSGHRYRFEWGDGEHDVTEREFCRLW